MLAPGPLQEYRGVRDITVIDDVLLPHQRKAVLMFLRNCGWRFGWKSNGKRDAFAFWHVHFAGHKKSQQQTKYDCASELAKNAPLLFAFWQQLAGTVFQGHTLYRCYANAHAYGSDGTLHTDSKSPHSYTAVYYPHEVWDPSWAGETVIFTKDRPDIERSIYPRGNRMAIFRGDSPHVARGVARICPELRITLMYKTMDRPLNETDIGDDDE